MNRKTFYVVCSGVVFISVLFCGGCSSQTSKKPQGISPIYPAMNHTFSDRYRIIETLSPEFQWKDLKQTNQTYDLAIWELPYRSDADFKSKLEQFHSSWGNMVFLTNNIATNVYQLPFPLKPDTYYNWSVRICEGDRVHGWNAYTKQETEFDDDFVYSYTYTYTYKHVPFGFKTPVASTNHESHVAN